jgi:phosphate transport system substrate-binding protein
MTNAPGPDSYPITATTFVLMYKHSKNPARTASALRFFRWALTKGTQQAIALQYVPLPPTLVRQIDGYMTQNIK